MVKKLQYYFINGLFIMSLCLFMYWVVSWYGGADVNPKKIMSGLALLAYSLCMIGFNWPDSKRMIVLRSVGLLLSLVMMIVSLLIINDTINFQASWSIVIAGASISLMLATVFQIYRVRDFDTGWKKYYKWGLIALSIVFFSWIGYLYILQPGAHSVYSMANPIFISYSLLLIAYFVIVAIKTKAYKPKLNR